MSLGAHSNPQASNSSTRTAAALASAFAKASRKSVRSAVLDLPFQHDAKFIDKNGKGIRRPSPQAPAGKTSQVNNNQP
jgi:hypothetical protein